MQSLFCLFASLLVYFKIYFGGKTVDIFCDGPICVCICSKYTLTIVSVVVFCLFSTSNDIRKEFSVTTHFKV